MKISAQGLRLLMDREGCVLKPYLDTVGVWTDGYGNTVGVVPNGPSISMEKAEADFAMNIKRFEDALNEALTVEIPQHSYDALVSWLFNVGTGWASKATLMKKINAGDMAGAAKEFDRWNIPKEIIRRRNGEREQFKGTAFDARA